MKHNYLVIDDQCNVEGFALLHEAKAFARKRNLRVYNVSEYSKTERRLKDLGNMIANIDNSDLPYDTKNHVIGLLKKEIGEIND